MSDSVRPHRRQLTRLSGPWDSPGKNTGVGCHFLLQCMKVKSKREVTQSCLTLSDPSLVPGSAEGHAGTGEGRSAAAGRVAGAAEGSPARKQPAAAAAVRRAGAGAGEGSGKGPASGASISEHAGSGPCGADLLRLRQGGA